MIKEVIRMETLLDRISAQPLNLRVLTSDEEEFFEKLEDVRKRGDRQTYVYYVGIYNEVHNSKYDDSK